VSRNNVILDTVDLDTAPYEREATGLWLDVSKAILDLMHAKGLDPAAAIHAAEHAFLNRFAMAADLKTECKAPEKEYKSTESQRKRPARCV
jgi:DEAD/DEAH box helicase domain-containing protein